MSRSPGLSGTTLVSEGHQAKKSEVAPGHLMDNGKWELTWQRWILSLTVIHRSTLLVSDPTCTSRVSPPSCIPTSIALEAGPLRSVSPITGPLMSLNPHSLFANSATGQKSGTQHQGGTSTCLPHNKSPVHSGMIGIPISLQSSSPMQVIKTKPRSHTSCPQVPSNPANLISAPGPAGGKMDNSARQVPVRAQPTQTHLETVPKTRKIRGTSSATLELYFATLREVRSDTWLACTSPARYPSVSLGERKSSH